MNVTMRVDPDKALNGAFAPDLDHSGWVQGWGIIKGPPDDREFAGTLSQPRGRRRGCQSRWPGFEARWGSYSESEQDLITGDTNDADDLAARPCTLREVLA